jgi:hypothetical protein
MTLNGLALPDNLILVEQLGAVNRVVVVLGASDREP